MEWFNQSQLTLTLRLPNPIPREEQGFSLSTIAGVAEHLRLWPSTMYEYDEYNQNPTNTYVVGSDGSYTVCAETTADVLASEQALRRVAKGAAGITLLPHGYDNTRHIAPAIHIGTKHRAPGMNAFLWELVAQAITLHFTKHLPSHTVITSDCTGALAYANQSKSTKNNQLPNVQGGIFCSGMHDFADPHYSNPHIHTGGHPERFPHRAQDPTIRDKVMLMADAAAGRTSAKMNGQVYPMDRFDLLLEDIFAEILPVHQWYLCTMGPDPFPAFDNLLSYQHAVQLAKMTKTRDAHHDHRYWTDTALEFAHKIHPLSDRSFWTAARRTLIAFDWMGHGRNRAKPTTLTPEEREATAKCHHCGELDSQHHCMLDCPYPPFTQIRETARQNQQIIARELRVKHSSDRFQHFIRTLCRKSWTPDPHISRIWLGLWTQETLASMIRQSTAHSLSMAARKTYQDIVRRLTAPLLEAYQQQLDLTIKTSESRHARATRATTPQADPRAVRSAPLRIHQDHVTTTTTTQMHPLSSLLSQRLEATFIQEPATHATSLLTNLDIMNNTLSHYTQRCCQ